jgi:trigger factor
MFPMTTYLEKLPDCRATLRVEVDAPSVRERRRQIVSEFARQAKIPGFRPGKVPVEVVEKRYKKAIEEELRDQLVRQGCQEGVRKEGVVVVHLGEIGDAEFHDDESFTFTVNLQTAPEFELPEYKGIPVTVTRVEVTDHDVDHQVEHLRQGLAKFEAVEGRGAETGDFAVVDFTAELDGVPVGDVVPEAAGLSSVEGHWMPLRPGNLIPGFCEQLVGQQPGEIRKFDLTVPEDFGLEALRGRTLAFAVTLLELKRQVLPELTDELVREAFRLEGGVAALRDRLRERLRHEQEEQRAQEITTQLLEHLDQGTSFELPGAVLTRETQRQVNRIVRQSLSRGMPDGEVMEHKDAIIRHASTQAEVNVKTSFILRQIADQEGIEATPEEVVDYCARQAVAAGVPLKKYAAHIRKSDLLDDVKETIVRFKTLAYLREHAVLTETERPPHECDLPEHQSPDPAQEEPAARAD